METTKAALPTGSGTEHTIMEERAGVFPAVAVTQDGILAPATTAVSQVPTNEITDVVIPTRGQHEIYSNAALQTIQSVADEAKELFTPGKSFESPQDLRQQLRTFAHKKGFEITSQGNKYTCTRCEEPVFRKNARSKRTTVPLEKQRKRISTRVGCLFQVCYAFSDWRNKNDNKSIKITSSSMYCHSNGCLPSRSQLAVEKRNSRYIHRCRK